VTGLEVGREAPGWPVAENPNDQAKENHPQRLARHSLNQLMLSQSNVRQIKAGVSIEELAEAIARRTLLSSITVRPVLDDSGGETGMYTIPAGGPRFGALELLVKQKRMNKTALVPCIVRTDSLAENVQRALLHPLDQFRAFQAMRRSKVEIA
jgi:ParB family chromosome partitioning protein